MIVSTGFQTRVAEAKASSEPIRVSAQEIERLLEIRFHPINEHVFPVSPCYEPISGTVGRLERVLTGVRSGYIAVIGAPGSGKSELLTRSLVQSARPEQIIRYYCHVPDDAYGPPPRGDARSFLNDIVVQLEACGFLAGEALPKLELDALRHRFGEQLKQVADHFRQSGQKTLVIIDGLDYADLDEGGQIHHPLLPELPRPDQLGDGVVIILGTQHLRGLDSSITRQLQDDPTRRIEMSPLSQAEVLAVIERSSANRWLEKPTQPGNRTPCRVASRGSTHSRRVTPLHSGIC